MIRLAALVASFWLLGCAQLGLRAVVSVDEYADFRNFRVAPTVEAKLGAAYEYLRTYPRGAFRPEVRAWFSRTDSVYVDRAWKEVRALEAFLRAVPAGPQADRAAARLVELRLAESHGARQEKTFDDRIRALEGRLAVAEAGRRALVRDVVTWARRLSAIRTWGGRTSELNHEFIYAFRLSPPAARCDEETCTKTVTVSYSVPEGKAQSAREALYDVGLRLERGGVRSAWLTGPELFTRLGEAARVAAVAADDWMGRAEAIGQATQMIALAVEPVLPVGRCDAPAVSPVVLRRVCDGVELRVISATELGEEDRVVVEPSGPAAP